MTLRIDSAGVLLTTRGSARGLVLWLGAVMYFGYHGVMVCFATPSNDFSLAYVGLLALSLWSGITTLAGIDQTGRVEVWSPGMPYRRLATVFGVFRPGT